LIEKLPEAIVRTYSLVTLRLIDVQEPRIIQLYPDFEKQTWEFLLIPTANAFGKYIDRYYSFTENQTYLLKSVEEFNSKFSITEFDEYKLLINPRQHSNNNER
jgi:hypothetical protein